MSPNNDRPTDKHAFSDPHPLTEADWARLDRFASGEGTAEERQALAAWIASRESLGALAESMRTPDVAGPSSADEWDALAAWSEAAKRTGIEAKMPMSANRSAIQWSDPRVSLAILPGHRSWGHAARHRVTWSALSTLALVVGLIVGYSILKNPRLPAVGHHYATAPAQQLSLTLGDGTHVILGPASALDVPNDYAGGHRAVRLEGEAIFSVVHNAKHPFSVYARDVVATDVGTRFDVRGYPQDPSVRIAVVEGQVAVANAALGAGDVAEVRGSRIAVQRNADVMTLTSWSRGELAFHGASLREVSSALSRWYDLDVVVADPALDTLRLTATFGDEPVAQVLHVVSASLGIRAERTGRSVRFLHSLN